MKIKKILFDSNQLVFITHKHFFLTLESIGINLMLIVLEKIPETVTDTTAFNSLSIYTSDGFVMAYRRNFENWTEKDLWLEAILKLRKSD